jgi:hypothetical protein
MGQILRRAFCPRNWAAERPHAIAAQTDVRRTTADIAADLFDLSKTIKELKKQVNRIYRTAKSRHSASDPVLYTDEESRNIASLRQDINMKEAEWKLKNNNNMMLKRTLNNLMTYISQQDAIQRLKGSMEVIKKAGIDFTSMDRVIEDAANTTDQVQMMTEATEDRMMASAGTFTIEDLTTDEVPYPEVETQLEVTEVKVDDEEPLHEDEPSLQLSVFDSKNSRTVDILTPISDRASLP